MSSPVYEANVRAVLDEAAQTRYDWEREAIARVVARKRKVVNRYTATVVILANENPEEWMDDVLRENEYRNDGEVISVVVTNIEPLELDGE